MCSFSVAGVSILRTEWDEIPGFEPVSPTFQVKAQYLTALRKELAEKDELLLKKRRRLVRRQIRMAIAALKNAKRMRFDYLQKALRYAHREAARATSHQSDRLKEFQLERDAIEYYQESYFGQHFFEEELTHLQKRMRDERDQS